VRVLLADDHEPVLEELEDLLAAAFEVVGTARSGVQMLTAALEKQPDIIVADIEMPEMSGIEAGRELMKVCPTVPIVLLTMHANWGLLQIALKAGFRGYVLKMRADEELIPAIREALDGRTFVSPALVDSSGGA
jgi:DNA-binding NarL/FixJ family response regulator